MSTHEYPLPDVGEGTAEGELLQWYVAEGDRVEEDQVIAEVETDKAVVDIPAPVDGTVSELLFGEGDVIPVGDVFVVFEVGDGAAAGTASDASSTSESAPTPAASDAASAANENDSETAPATTAGRSFAPPSVRRLAREHGVALDDLTGSGPSGRVTEADVQAAADAEADTTTGSDDSGGPVEVESVSEPASSAAARDRTLAQPTTRRVAHELGVDIDAVPEVETWEGETFVTIDAVREFAEGGADTQAPTPSSGPAETDTSVTVEERIPYRGVRRTIGEQMERSKFTIPHVSTVDEVDVTELVELRERLVGPAEERGAKLTYLSFAVKAVGTALQEFPYLNASLDTDAGEIVLKGDYNVGIATESEDGLRVPVVDDVDEKGLLQIAAEVNEVTQQARDGSITRDQMRGGTFTISNIGPYGGEHGTPIINYPEVGIIAMGRVKEKPRVVDDDIVKRHVLKLSLSFDHRVVDGAMATQFLNRVKEQLETPELFLLD
ncbi:dihydrolipoamide acetyltransferase family protein [Halorarius litoreus]|uniref:dihydrolipoamide acetyltransferase family protein n=1 Tax=Halorarius litoreus TaxID=2962676 RepID=UPI0020CEFDC3|nr:dihydrolipoamide acetyltransferase family protein [Halorarius litoreus]